MHRRRFSRRHAVVGPILWVVAIAVPVLGCAALMPHRTRTLAAFAVIGAGLAVLVGPRAMRSAR